MPAELEGPTALAAMLGVEIPSSWPQPLYNWDATGWILRQMENVPGFERWGFRAVRTTILV